MRNEEPGDQGKLRSGEIRSFLEYFWQQPGTWVLIFSCIFRSRSGQNVKALILPLPRRAEEQLHVEQEGKNRCDGIKLRKGQVRSLRLESSSNEGAEAPSHRLKLN